MREIWINSVYCLILNLAHLKWLWNCRKKYREKRKVVRDICLPFHFETQAQRIKTLILPTRNHFVKSLRRLTTNFK